jgi:hypothetical protein
MASINRDTAISVSNIPGMIFTDQRRRMHLQLLVSSALEQLDVDAFDLPSTVYSMHHHPTDVSDDEATEKTNEIPFKNNNVLLLHQNSLPNIIFEQALLDSIHVDHRTNDAISLESRAGESFDHDSQFLKSKPLDDMISQKPVVSTKRCVQFSITTSPEKEDSSVPVITLSTNECIACWWGTEHMISVKHEVHQITQRCRHSLRGQELVASTIQYTCDVVHEIVASCSIEANDHHMLEDLMIDPSPYANELISWTNCAGSRRGLERFLCLKKRTTYRSPRGYRSRVLRAYAKGESEDNIARIASEASLYNRVLARMMGYADAKMITVGNGGLVCVSASDMSMR